jgi:N-formylglutamate deformylase
LGLPALSTVHWKIEYGDEPIVAAAIHDGHKLRTALLPFIALSDEARRREEDPFTASWAQFASSKIIGCHSRFEVDLNRPREKAVYLEPQDAWGLCVWNQSLPEALVVESRMLYDEFYEAVGQLLDHLLAKSSPVVVYDLHTYNHRRRGPYAELDDPALNPDVNVGTGTMDRIYWAPLVDRFIHDLRQAEFPGDGLDVRENVRFFGGQFARWIHQAYPQKVCVLSIEFKKFFMDEWTGQVDERLRLSIQQALASTLPGVREAIHSLRP